MAGCVIGTDRVVISPSHTTCDTVDALDSSGTDDDYLVQVRAQVMTRDDSSGGWLPTHGGGMSMVGLRAVPPPGNTQYLIHGRRLCDQAVILDCTITDDLMYVKATPTFHHWRTCGKRFGLTFHSSADAQVFETCIQRAAHQLQERPSNKKKDSTYEADDEIAVLKLQPPLDMKEVSSLPASRTRTPSPTATMRVNGPSGVAYVARTSRVFAPNSTYHPFSCPHLDFAVERSFYRRYGGTFDKPIKSGCKGDNELPDDTIERTPSTGDDIYKDLPSQSGRTDGYVRFSRTDVSAASTASGPLTSGTSTGVTVHCKSSSPFDDSLSTGLSTPHEYEYPVLSASTARPRESSLPPTIQQVALPRRKQKKPARRQKKALSSARARCIYCQELFFVAENHCGVCPDAPDECAACIERATCLCAARALLYHCATDDDGDYGPVCSIGAESSPSSSSSSERRRRRKWVLLALLSIVLPCLWCYPALAACHRCSVRHGHCGARHRAA